jgi:hypothetical protein
VAIGPKGLVVGGVICYGERQSCFLTLSSAAMVASQPCFQHKRSLMRRCVQRTIDVNTSACAAVHLCHIHSSRSELQLIGSHHDVSSEAFNCCIAAHMINFWQHC